MNELAPDSASDNEKRPMRPFLTLWTGQTLSLVGSQSVQFAIIWWLTVQTGSAAILATAAFVGLFPQIAFGPVIGVLVDRWNRKAIMLASDSAVALTSIALAMLFVNGSPKVELVLALLFLRAVFGAFHGPAMLASTTLMVPKQHLTRIEGMNQMALGGLQIIAAPIGAFLVASLPMQQVMLVDVFTAMLAVVPLIFIRVPQPDLTTDRDSNKESVWDEMKAGLNYIRDRSGYIPLLSIAVLVNMCMVPAFSLLPLLVSEAGGGALELGWLSSTFGIGMIVGGVLLAVWGGFNHRILTTLAGLIGVGLATGLLGFAPNTSSLWAFGAIFGVGLMIPLVNGPILAVLQATVAPDHQGRVFALFASLAAMTTPLGLLVAAPLADYAGVQAWYYIGGIVCVALGFAGFFVPSLLRMEDGESNATQGNPQTAPRE